MIKVIFIALLIVLFLIGLIYLFNKKNEGYDQSWNFVDHVVCITFNKDKKYQDELRKRLSFIKPQNQIIIFKGYNDFGLLGYVRSHAFVLKNAIKNKWKNVLIIDDNTIWNNYEQNYKLLQNIVSKNPNYDVISLGNNNISYDPNTFKLKSGENITGYLVNGPYLKTLYNIFNNSEDSIRSLNSIKNVKLKREMEKEYRPDNIWKTFQEKDNWFIVHPPLLTKI
jgi:glycosyl transferase family 25